MRACVEQNVSSECDIALEWYRTLCDITDFLLQLLFAGMWLKTIITPMSLVHGSIHEIHRPLIVGDQQEKLWHAQNVPKETTL